MRRTKRSKQTLRGLRVETLERRNLLAFGGLRMFLSHSQDAVSTDLATETKSTIPAIVATPAPIQTPVVVQSIVPVSAPAVFALPASVPAESESTALETISVTELASQRSVQAEATVPSAVDSLVVETVDSSVSTRASLRSLISSPFTGTAVAVLNDVPSDEVLSSVSQSVNVENTTESISTNSFVTESNASKDSKGEPKSFIDTVALSRVGEVYLPQTTVRLNSGLEETNLADFDNGMGGIDTIRTDTFLEFSDRGNDNNGVQAIENSLDDTKRIKNIDSSIDEASVSELDNVLADSSSVFESGNASDDASFVGNDGLDGSGDSISLHSDNRVLDPVGVNDFENSSDSESVGDLDNSLDNSNGVFDSDNDGDDVAFRGHDRLSGGDLGTGLSDGSASNEQAGLDFGSIGDLDNGFHDIGGVFDSEYGKYCVGDDIVTFSGDGLSSNDFDNGIAESSSVNDREDGDHPLVTLMGASSATVNYGAWAASLVGSGTGSVVYQLEGYESEFSARVFGAAPNATLDVVVGGVLVGQIRTNGTGSGRLKLENDHGRALPVGFPVVGPMVAIEIGSSIFGVFGQLSSGSHDND